MKRRYHHQFSPLLFRNHLLIINSWVLVVILLVLGRFCGKSALCEAPSSDGRDAFDSSELLALHVVPVHKHESWLFFKRADVCM